MNLREPLISYQDGEDGAAFLTRALDVAKNAGGSGRLRLDVGFAFSLRDGKSYAGVSLWVERGTGRSESWQRVTPTITADSYAQTLAMFGEALDAREPKP